MARKTTPANPTIRVKAKLGSASIGAESASLGLKFSRDQIADLDRIVEFFVGSRLAVTIDADHDPDQEKFAGMDGEKLRSIADLGRASIGIEDVSAKLAFTKSSIDTHVLSDFAQRDVILTAERIGPTPVEEEPVPEEGAATPAAP